MSGWSHTWFMFTMMPLLHSPCLKMAVWGGGRGLKKNLTDELYEEKIGTPRKKSQARGDGMQTNDPIISRSGC